MGVLKDEMQEVELMHEEELQSSLTEMMACSPTSSATENETKPHPNQVQKCPRCDSFNTKFCYYNNYSLTQPRHFCKNCRRYWTKGGTLRNVPVGGGLRKNKRSKQRNIDQPLRCASAPPRGGRRGRGGSGEKSCDMTTSSGAVSTISGDKSSATIASTFSSSDGSPRPNNPLPQDAIGSCVTSGYLQLLGDGEEAVRLSFDAINTSSDGSPKTPMSQIGSSAASGFLTVVDGNSLPQLNGLPSLDAASMAINFSTPESSVKPDQNVVHNNNSDDLTQFFETLTHNISVVSPISHTESILVSSMGTDLVTRSNLGFHWRLQNREHHHQQQEQKPSAMPADHFLQSSIDEERWRRMIEDASTESFDKMRGDFCLADSHTVPYDVGNVAFDWQLGSGGFFDPTSDLCYMGGAGVWPDFPPFGAESGTLI